MMSPNLRGPNLFLSRRDKISIHILISDKNDLIPNGKISMFQDWNSMLRVHCQKLRSSSSPAKHIHLDIANTVVRCTLDYISKKRMIMQQVGLKSTLNLRMFYKIYFFMKFCI